MGEPEEAELARGPGPLCRGCEESFTLLRGVGSVSRISGLLRMKAPPFLPETRAEQLLGWARSAGGPVVKAGPRLR